jgi:cellobiose phosphorylase
VLTQFAEWRVAATNLPLPTLSHQAKALQKNIETYAWDGEWYRRAYFDNGERLVAH